MRLENKRVVITGSASGIGRATAQLMAKEGAKLVLADVNEAGLKETADAVRHAGGPPTLVPTDVSSMTSMNALFDTAVQSLGGIDAVINVAGVQRSASIEETDEPSWDAHFNVNAKSCFAAAKFAVPHLRRAGGGSFVSVASIAGIKGMAGLGAYSASKGAIVALTRSLAIELAPDNIRVNCLCPGWIDTPFNDPIISFMGGPAARDTMVSTSIPLRRQGEPPEMAAALTYLASDESSFMTGQALVIDGGMTV